ncbi:MAG: DNA mismatch repair protein MutS [Eubacteriales bacterium]|nr:DNA mismatch repair protein MutS [Eubacteriales bacterium]MDD4327288.1 DNA mismatch repair protein MutS [Eubacteriales bacterium]MDD4717757.1 DNA mismatch repair protein MutS [Eubacteriales bacterium]
MDNSLLDSVDRNNITPMMKQYIEQKEKWTDCILFYRLGDFYEMFFDDAVLVSKELELALTGRDCGLDERAPMCGVPYHAAESYLSKLVSKGYKVAVCEQVEDPALAKGIVKREVVRVVTPGTVTESSILEEKKNNYICSVFKMSSVYSVAFADLSTGMLEAAMIVYGNTSRKLSDEIFRRRPAEILCNEAFFSTNEAELIIKESGIVITCLDDENFSKETFRHNFPEHDEDIGIIVHPVAALASYFCRAGNDFPAHMRNIKVYSVEGYMLLDSTAAKNLEVFESLKDGGKRGSLLWAIDRTRTSMGGRLLRRWLEHPLMDIGDIEFRLEAVAELKDKFLSRQELIDILSGISDMERIAAKVSVKSVNPRELLTLLNALRKLPALKEAAGSLSSPLMTATLSGFDPLEDISLLIESSVSPDAPLGLKEGSIIKQGYSKHIDELRDASVNGKKWIAEYESRIKDESGIRNLKIKYTNNFGYMIEISNANKQSVPESFIRRQTLVNAERYVTEDLKKMEETILGAEQKLISADYECFCEIREEIEAASYRILDTAYRISVIDILTSFSDLADRENYCRPEISDGFELDIRNGRHPVVEKTLKNGEFVPNSVSMDKSENRFILITGPNMGGKSTYMRQNALLVILAQIGSFVPAESMRAGIVDKVFTRVGASDDLASGRSTFMVEMSEVAGILQNATPRSLLILDEIGRGTSTYDGLAIAWAVTEYLSDINIIGCRTMFATHYHELTELESSLEGVVNFHVQVAEADKEIVFLHTIAKGGSDDSYGIEVAKLAGVQSNVIRRAREILAILEKDRMNDHIRFKKHLKVMDGQLDIFTSSLALKNTDNIIEELKLLDVQKMTPVEALNKLYDLSDKARKLKTGDA